MPSKSARVQQPGRIHLPACQATKIPLWFAIALNLCTTNSPPLPHSPLYPCIVFTLYQSQHSYALIGIFMCQCMGHFQSLFLVMHACCLYRLWQGQNDHVPSNLLTLVEGIGWNLSLFLIVSSLGLETQYTIYEFYKGSPFLQLTRGSPFPVKMGTRGPHLRGPHFYVTLLLESEPGTIYALQNRGHVCACSKNVKF